LVTARIADGNIIVPYGRERQSSLQDRFHVITNRISS